MAPLLWLREYLGEQQAIVSYGDWLGAQTALFIEHGQTLNATTRMQEAKDK